MRVTESRMVDLSMQGVAQNRERVAEVQREIETGVRVDLPSKNLAAFAEGERASARKLMSGSRGSAIGRAQDSLGQTDSALESVSGVLGRARELAVQMANGTYGPGFRNDAATEVTQLRNVVLAAANVRGSDGEYLLAGSRGNAPAFDAAGVYQGDAGVRRIEISEGQTSQASTPGTVLTAASGVDVLGVLGNLVTALQANDVAGIKNTMDQLDTAITQVANARTDVAAKYQALQAADASRQAFEVHLAETHARAVETDTIQGASDFALAKNAMEASQTIAQQIIEIARPQ